MMKFHFLNVGQGDCSIIQHKSGHVTMIDCNLARKRQPLAELFRADAGTRGNFGQGSEPVNPIEYMAQHNIDDVFRFILTHADMDHMDGIKDIFEVFKPDNFWDTNNNKVIDQFEGTRYRAEDWKFYTDMRDGRITKPKRLVLNADATGMYYNRNAADQPGGDGLYVLAPTPALARAANSNDDQNDGSYVILYKSPAGNILFAGDSHDETWDYLLANHRADIADIDLLIAPHHGRQSDRDFEWLSVVRPKVTFFGVASSDHLAYGAWSSRNLQYFTQNQGGSFIVDTSGEIEKTLRVFCTNGTFAKKWTGDRNFTTYYDPTFKGHYLGHLVAAAARAA
jgi:beta-lactamase superfamily II metal-dependent hydrolase